MAGIGSRISLLDCTLRDGGYLNDWEFGESNLVSIFERLTDAGVDFVELGFLDQRRKFDPNRSIMPNTECMNKIYGGLNKHNSGLLGMIDYGTCDISNIQPADETVLDGIRVIFKKHLRKEALEFCAELKALGYMVFAQLVSVTSYSDEEMRDLIRLANEVRPYAVSMVDTYGLMHNNKLWHYFKLLEAELHEDIRIGYHGHNNFQMAYSNSIDMMSWVSDRKILVDGTLYGMGKSAGNAPIELLSMWMNDSLNKRYDISQLLEAIDCNISPIYNAPKWGYNILYYISAMNDCHPNYVTDLIQKRTLSVKSINEILHKLKGEKQLLYDPVYLEGLYQEYQSIEVDDSAEYRMLGEALKGKKILLLAPGKNVRKEFDRIKDVIDKENPVIISINFIDMELESDYLFLTNSKRYVQLASKLSRERHRTRIIATSNLTKTSGKFDFTLRFGDLMDTRAYVLDNPFLMFLNIAPKLGIKELYLAGFDGYVGNAKNYICEDMEYAFDDRTANEINGYVTQKVNECRKSTNIMFITGSLYNV